MLIRAITTVTTYLCEVLQCKVQDITPHKKVLNENVSDR